MAEDCVLFEPFGAPVSGLENIVTKMKEALPMAEIHDVSFESQEVYHHHGGWLVDFGTFSETLSLDGKEDPLVVEGNYAAVLEQDAVGDWKVKRFMAMPNKPFFESSACIVKNARPGTCPPSAACRLRFWTSGALQFSAEYSAG